VITASAARRRDRRQFDGHDHGAQSRNILDFRHRLGILPPMQKRGQFALAVLLVAIGGVIAWQILRGREHEPVYRGKRLSLWLNYRTALKAQEAHDAVRQAGTNAIPTLLRMLRAKDSGLKVGLMNLVQRQRIITIDYTRAEEWRGFGT
jgi:hypothetical protein